MGTTAGSNYINDQMRSPTSLITTQKQYTFYYIFQKTSLAPGHTAHLLQMDIPLQTTTNYRVLEIVIPFLFMDTYNLCYFKTILRYVDTLVL